MKNLKIFRRGWKFLDEFYPPTSSSVIQNVINLIYINHLVFVSTVEGVRTRWNTEKCISVWSCRWLTKTAHTCYQPFNASTPFGAPNRGHRERIVPLLNPDGRGQWYCHPFRGCRGHVAHPLARFKGAVGKGRPRAAVAGAVTDVHPSAKANTKR